MTVTPPIVQSPYLTTEEAAVYLRLAGGVSIRTLVKRSDFET